MQLPRLAHCGHNLEACAYSLAPCILSSAHQDADYYYDNSTNSDELESLCSFMKSALPSNATSIKERIKEKILSLQAEVDTCDNVEALSTLAKQLSAANSTPTDLSPQCLSPANNRMEMQCKFHSTKQKRVSRSAVQYTHPMMKEKDIYLNILTSASLGKDPSKSVTLSYGQSTENVA